MNIKLRRCFLAVIFTGLTIFLLGRWILYKVYVLLYEEFRDNEAKANPKFATLNDTLYSQVSIPTGVSEVRKNQQVTLDSSHGIYMSLDYLMINIDPKDVLSYYENFFLAKEWDKYILSSNELRFVYYRETGCYEVAMFVDNVGKILRKYSVYIYHDFFDQEFSPSVPSSSVMGFNEIGKTDFIRCPPFLDPPNYLGNE